MVFLAVFRLARCLDSAAWWLGLAIACCPGSADGDGCGGGVHMAVSGGSGAVDGRVSGDGAGVAVACR